MSQQLIAQVFDNVARVIVGKKETVEMVLTALLAGGHVLLEDVPGLGKTMMAKAVAYSLGLDFRRIQFTPDLLPGDVTGFYMYDQRTGEFTFRPGPIMANVILADEINRTPPRTQASLLESMEEQQITVEGVTSPLPQPFFVIATQNPIELEGTFPLPEAQLDRFLLKVSLGYPSMEEEREILHRFQRQDPLKDLTPVVEREQVLQLKQAVSQVYVSNSVSDYLLELVRQTRTNPGIKYGASPRASLGFFKAAQALALIRGREYVLPDDIQDLAVPVLAHRLVLSHDAAMRRLRAEDVIRDIMKNTAIPLEK